MPRRVFLAFPLPQTVREYLHTVTNELDGRLTLEEEVRWVDVDGMHITGHFLADQEDEPLRQIDEIARATAARYPAVTARLERVAFFPPAGPPRVIIAPVIEDDGLVLRRLQAELGRGLERAGINVDHRLWTPHVTLGRVKTGVQPRQLDYRLDSPPFRLTTLELISSQLTEDGALYAPLSTYPLAA